MNLPTLYHRGKGGAIYSWRIWTEGDDIVTEYGQKDGKKQIARKKAIPKNVGRSNNTTAEEQALAEAKAMHTFKIERKYRATEEETEEEIFLPMLAQEYEKRKAKISFPVDMQPKFNGVRALAYWEGDEVKLLSRGGKFWELPRIIKALETFLPKESVLDGEIYLHGATLQGITRLVKKERPQTAELAYNVYDLPVNNGDGDLTWENRRIALEDLFKSNKTEEIVLVKTERANSDTDVMAYHKECIGQFYEGAMVRTLGGVYRFGYRSGDLLKVKAFKDAEFKIVGYDHGTGKFAKCVVWKCITPEGLTFNVVPKGTLEDKEEWFANGDKHIGQMLTVKFFDYTEDKKPFLPVGIAIRAAEDLPKKAKSK